MSDIKNITWMPEIWNNVDYEEFEKSVKRDVEQLRKEGMLLFFLNDPLSLGCINTTRRVVGICLGNDIPVVLMLHKLPGSDIMLGFVEKEKRGMIGWLIMQDMVDLNGERVLLLKELHEGGYKVLVRIDVFDNLPVVYGFFQAVYSFCDLFYLMSSDSADVYQRMLVDMILDIGDEGAKVCFSDELLEKAGLDRGELPVWCVDEEYSLWSE